MPRILGHVKPSYIDSAGAVQSIPWGQYKTYRPDWSAVQDWFARGDASTLGLVLLTGTPAGKGCAPLQILDIETADLFDTFIEAAQFAGHGQTP